jgi:hypothetical protein
LEIRKEREEKRDQNGKVNAYVDKVFRGKEMILMTVTLLETNKYGLRMRRSFLIDGNEVLTELHYNDGRPETIRTYKNNILYEEFKRQSDGSVEPVSSGELGELKKKAEAIKAKDLNGQKLIETKR